MLVMYHEFEYSLDTTRYKITSYMVNIGENQVYTSMSNTVGLPIAICGKMLLNNEINLKGVHIPVEKEVYEPILNELQQFGILFKENKFEFAQ